MPNNTTITTEQLRTMLFATEDGSNPHVLNTFSYAGGNSGYSFGLLQFDIDHDPAARKFLEDNHFNQQDIKQLRKHGKLEKSELDPLNKKLQAIPQSKINEFTNGQLQNIITKIDNLIDILRITNPAAARIIADSWDLQLRIADYTNQYHINGEDPAIDPNDNLVRYLSGERVFLSDGSMQFAPGETVTPDHIWEFIERNKFNVKWEQAQATDPKNKKRAPLNRPSVASREQRLQGVLRQIDRPSWLPSLPNGATSAGARRTQLDLSNGVCPPIWSQHDDLGVCPPSVGADETHGGLF
jgi:hypothetical protein